MYLLRIAQFHVFPCELTTTAPPANVYLLYVYHADRSSACLLSEYRRYTMILYFVLLGLDASGIAYASRCSFAFSAMRRILY